MQAAPPPTLKVPSAQATQEVSSVADPAFDSKPAEHDLAVKGAQLLSLTPALNVPFGQAVQVPSWVEEPPLSSWPACLDPSAV